MKNPLHCIARLEDILRTEITILSDLYLFQKRMYECVLVRDWVLLETETSSSEVLVNSFLEQEKIRINILSSLIPEIEGSKDFYRVTALFPEVERVKINTLFREMKRLLLLSKTENEVFNAYVSNARSVVSGMIETFLPARKNKIYTRRGSLASAKVENLVVNRSF